MKAFKNLLSLMLCIALLVGMVPGMVFAAQPEPISYTLNPSAMPSGALNDWSSRVHKIINGVYKNEWGTSSNGKQTTLYNSVLWSEEYSYKVKLKNNAQADSNKAWLIFNAVDDFNYYYVEFGGGNTPTITLNKSVEGSAMPLAVYNVNPEEGRPVFPVNVDGGATIEVLYNRNAENKIVVKGTAKDGTEIVLFESKDTSLSYGKIGFGSYNSEANMHSLSVNGMGEKIAFEVVNTSIEAEETGVSLTPQIELEFSHPIDASNQGTIKDNILIYYGYNRQQPERSQGTLAANAYDVTVSGNLLTITVKSALPENTLCALYLKKNIRSLTYKNYMYVDYVLPFTTKLPPFDVVLSANKPAPGALAFTGTVQNNEMPQYDTVALTVAVENPNGEMLCSQSFELDLPLGESVPFSGSLMVPANVSPNAIIKVYAVDSFASMKPISNVQPQPFADSDFAYAAVNIETNEVTITGVLPNQKAGRVLTLLVLNPGKDIDDIAADATALQNQGEFVTGEGGTISFKFPFHVTDGTTSDLCKVYLGGDDLDTPKQLVPFVIATQQQRIDAVNDLKSGITEAKLEQYADVLAYRFPPYAAIDVSKLATRIATLTFANDDLGDVQKTLQQHVLLEAYNQSKQEVVFSKEGDILYSDLLMEDANEAMLSAYNFYEDKTTEKGQKLVRSDLFAKKLADVAAWQKLFAQQAVIRGIKNCKTNGHGHINPLLRNSGAYAGLDLRKYNQLGGETGKADKEILSSTFETIAQLQTVIDKAATATDDTPKNPSRPSSNGFQTTPNISPTPQPTLVPKPENEVVLNDMADAEWARPAIVALINKKIVEQPADGNFYPMRNVTREEFVKMIVASLGLSLGDTNSGFEDVPQSHWSAPYITAAKKANIVTGIDATHFGPGEPVTRQDVATILYRAFKSKISDAGVEEQQFTDADEIDKYAQEAVKNLTKANIINGMGDGSFAPKQFCTRAQAAKLIYGVSQ